MSSSYADLQRNYYKRARDRERAYFTGGASDTVFTIRNAANIAKKARIAITNKRDAPSGMADIEHDYQRVSRRKGRNKRLTLRRLAKLSRTGLQSINLRYFSANEAWKGITQDTIPGSFGANKLFWHLDTDANGGNGQLWYPMHVYDVSSFGNFTGSSFAWGTPVVGTATISGSGGVDVAYDQVVGWKVPPLPDGTGGTIVWQPENAFSVATSTDHSPWRTGVWRWLDARILLYGRTNYPTRFKISLIQIPDETCNFAEPDGAYGGANPKAAAHINAVMAPFLYNPVNNSDARNGYRNWKTLMTHDCVIHATNNIGTATVPNTKLVKFFWRANRIQRYDWRDGDRLRADADGDYVSDAVPTEQNLTYKAWQQTLSECQRTVHPKARVYLVVQSMSHYTTSTTVPGPSDQPQGGARSWNDTPSYDINIRVRHDINP